MNKDLNIKDVKLLSARSKFLNITYNALEEKQGPHGIIIDDICDSVNVKNDVVTFVFQRNVKIENNLLFDIVVKAESAIKFKREDKYTDKDYQDFFKVNYMYYYRYTSVASTISLIVGQITSSFGRAPLLVAFKDK